MPDMNGNTTPYCGSNNYMDPWASIFFGTDSLRRENLFLSEQTRQQNSEILSSLQHEAGALTVAIEKIGAATNLAIEKIGAAQILATEKTSAALALQASQNHQTLSAQMAECCCEIKEKIAADGQLTRDLINSIESDRLRTENAQLTARLLALETRSSGGHS